MNNLTQQNSSEYQSHHFQGKDLLMQVPPAPSEMSNGLQQQSHGQQDQWANFPIMSDTQQTAHHQLQQASSDGLEQHHQNMLRRPTLMGVDSVQEISNPIQQ